MSQGSDVGRDARVALVAVYEQTPAWASTRARLWAAQGRCCAACGRTERQGARLHVHHRSTAAYDASLLYPGREWLSHLVGLCSGCHQRCHDTYETSSLSLEAATDLVLRSTLRWTAPPMTPPAARVVPEQQTRVVPEQQVTTGGPATYSGSQVGFPRSPVDPAPIPNVFDQWEALAERTGIPSPRARPKPTPTELLSPAWVKPAPRDVLADWDAYAERNGIRSSPPKRDALADWEAYAARNEIRSSRPAAAPPRHWSKKWVWVLLCILPIIAAGVGLYWFR